LSRQMAARLFRLYALSRRLPDGAQRDFRRAREIGAARRQGAAALHHRRSGARHAQSDGRVRQGVRSPHRRPHRDARRNRRRGARLSRLFRQGRRQGRARRLSHGPQLGHLCDAARRRAVRRDLHAGDHRRPDGAAFEKTHRQPEFLIGDTAMMRLSLIAAAYAAGLAAAAAAEPSAIAVTDAWARATPPGAKTGAAYVTVTNTGKAADRLMSAATPVAGAAQLHTTLTENGVMKMRPV